MRTLRDEGWRLGFAEDPDDPDYILTGLWAPDRSGGEYVGRFHGSEAAPAQN